jgi:hypothetical protein
MFTSRPSLPEMQAEFYFVTWLGWVLVFILHCVTSAFTEEQTKPELSMESQGGVLRMRIPIALRCSGPVGFAPR